MKKIKNWIKKEDNKMLAIFSTLALVFMLVVGMSVSELARQDDDDRTVKTIETTDGGTADLIYNSKGELEGVDTNSDGEVDSTKDEMTLWGSTKISDSHLGTELLALNDTGEITFGGDQDISLPYNVTSNSIEWTGGDLDFNGKNITGLGSLNAEQIFSNSKSADVIVHKLDDGTIV